MTITPLSNPSPPTDPPGLLCLISALREPEGRRRDQEAQRELARMWRAFDAAPITEIAR